MKIFSLVLFLTLFSCYSFVHAQKRENNILMQKVLAQLKLKQSDINQELYAEKVLPNAKTQTVIVIPKYRKNEPDGYGNFYLELDAYIIIADNTTGKILYQYYEENAWTSDAIRISAIMVDTGIFTLNSDTRAFGVKVYYQGSSQPNPHHHTDLSLFIKTNQSLKKVLNNFTIENFGGEWDTKCAGEFEEVTSTIIIDKGNKIKNFNSLMVRDKIIKIKNAYVNEDCIEKKTITHRTGKLKYNGVEYTR